MTSDLKYIVSIETIDIYYFILYFSYTKVYRKDIKIFLSEEILI